MTTATELHRRLSAFVDWIATERSREDELRARSSAIRGKVRSKAEADGLTISSTPNSGSFATRTGLRRHMRGHSEVEGQDVDLPFVVSPKTEDEERLDVLLPRFEVYAREAYPETERTTTKSSIKLMFADQVNFDLVPLFSTTDPEHQVLVRADAEKRETSVQKHIEFIRGRSRKSNEVPGRVKFNEVVRLLKWWRCVQQDDGRMLTDVPSFVMNLLAAAAFDARGVQATYGETIADWFGFLARVVRSRTIVTFDDFGPRPTGGGSAWSVFDPVNPKNNIVDKWSGVMCDELADWLEESRDAMYDAIAAFNAGRDNDGLECLVRVFGTAIRHHSEA